jgi:alpha-tubulin suppressor-like RCC1 family protein
MHGQLGIGAPAAVALPSRVAGALAFSHIRAGLQHTCALTTAGRAYCWGSNESGQVGNGRTMSWGATLQMPTKVATHHTLTALDTRFSHTCALTAAGEALCWGRNDFGQLGDGSDESRSKPVRVRTDLRFTAIAAGAHHSCALTAGGRAYCWGDNAYAQLGDNTLTSRAAPAPVHGDVRFRTLSAGNNVTCGTTDGGEAWCWGSSHFGALGSGLTGWDTVSPVPVRVVAP